MKKYLTIKELLDDVCERFYDREAFILENQQGYEKKLYGEFKRDCCHFAKALAAKGYVKTHVGLLCKTSYRSIVALFGSILASDTAVVVDCNYPALDISAMFERTDVRAVLSDEGNITKMNELKFKGITPKAKISISALMNSEVDDQVTVPLLEPDRSAIILFTSETAKMQSRAVVLSNETVCTNAAANAANYNADEISKVKGNTTIAILPIHHFMFLAFVTTVMQEAKAVYFNTNISNLMEELKIIKPCTITVTPAIVEQIYNTVINRSKHNPDIPIREIVKQITGGKLCGMTCGPDELNSKYGKAFLNWGIIIIQGYGLSEASFYISNNSFKNFKIGSVGKPLPDVEVKIVDGEIWAKGKSVMKSYYKDETVAKESTEDGWLKTGDLGFFDEEGYLYLTGRKKNFIILSSGENVSTEEIKPETFKENDYPQITNDFHPENSENTGNLYFKNEDLQSKKLPVAEQTEITTYLNRSLPLCVILANENYKNWYYSNYIQIMANTDEKGYVLLDYIEPRDSYAEILDVICLGYNMIEESTDIIAYIRDKINLGFYLIMNIDEYELYCKEHFMKEHFVHPSLIYGYDDQTRTLSAIGFDQFNMFTAITMNYGEMRRAYNSGVTCYKETAPWCEWSAVQLIKPRTPEREYPFNLRKFKRDLYEYINSIADPFRLYTFEYDKKNITCGMNVYSIFIKNIYNALGKTSKIDYRAIHLLAEHKKRLYDRMSYVSSSLHIQRETEQILGQYKKLADTYEKHRINCYKLIWVKDLEEIYGTIKKIADSIPGLVEQEKQILNKYYDILNTSKNQ